MVSELVQVGGEYVQQLQGMSFVPPFSFGRGLYRDDGGPNRLFFTYLFCDKALAIRFLTDVKLIRNEVLCETCGRFMRLCAEPIVSEGFRWRCNTRSAGVTCRRSMSIRDGSWFQQSNLTLLEILLLTHHIVCREQAQQIQSEYRFASHTLANWGVFCREVMLVYLERSSVKIGGPNKTVEIDESKFGRRKYHRGHPVKGQWVFGGVEQESGRTFLVPMLDRTANTILTIIRDWIEPGTSVISDCWGAYHNLGSQGYTHRTVNHGFWFCDPVNGAQTNTIESKWHRVKVFMGHYNRGEDYEYHLVHYLFAARCKGEGIPPFIQFLHLITNTDWSLCNLAPPDRRAP